MQQIKFWVFALYSTLLISSPTASSGMTDPDAFPLSENSPKLEQDVNLKINGTSTKLVHKEIARWFKKSENITFSPDYFSEIENYDRCLAETSILCPLVDTLSQKPHWKKTSTLSLEEQAIRQYLEDLARRTDKDPENAKLQIENDKASVFSLSTNGISLDIEKSLAIIKSYLLSPRSENSLALAYNETKPEITTQSIDNLGITSLIGEGRSSFAGSPKNRIFNIKVATKRYDGALIKPGDEFSFVEVLGPVDGDHGYLPELVIKHDKTEPEFGGGICQVSTTVFRAALNAGLKITARKNHAYPVQYYNPQGMDATVYVPRPDLRFINNTPGYILIQPTIEGTNLTFRFYGTSDGRKVELQGPTILERNPDGSMKTTLVQKVYDAENAVLVNDIFNSSYASPSKFPHPGSVLTEKPADWSKNEWKKYKSEHGL